MTPKNTRGLGTALIWIGVLAWAPFFYLVGTRQAAPILPFLVFHLAGVFAGAWLRKRADGLEGVEQTKSFLGQRRRTASKVLIYLGVLAWAPYFYFTRVLGQQVEIAPFLAAHLTGILGGAAVRASVEFERLIKRR